MNAIIYVRISHDKDKDNEAEARQGVDRQREACERLAADRGFTVIEDAYVDNDLSAFTGKERPGWEAVTDRMRHGGVDYLVAWAGDRLTRHQRELEDLVDLLEQVEVQVVTVTSGDYDLSTPEGRAVARIVGAIAVQESERKSVRMKAANRDRAEKGQTVGGGIRAFGYEADGYTIRESEASWLRDVARAIIDGASNRSQSFRLNDAGVKTTRDGKWTPASLRRVLINPRYVGKRTYHGEVIADAEWAAVFDSGTWERLQAALTSPSRAAFGRGRPPVNWLNKVAVCGLCGRGLSSVGSGHNGRRRYGCRKDIGGCGRIVIFADRLEETVAENILERAGTPAQRSKLAAAATGVDERQVDQLQAGIDAAEERKQDAAVMYGSRMIDRAQLATISQTAEAEITASRRQLQGMERDTALADVEGNLTDEWETLPTEMKRRYARALFVEVTVKPDPPNNGHFGFNPDRIKPIWRI
jgi:DNA invertase Pin-like site-specific DNA recombinase